MSPLLFRSLTAAAAAATPFLLAACNGMLPPEGAAMLRDGEQAYRAGDYRQTITKMDQFLLGYGQSIPAAEGYYLRGLARAQLKQRPQAKLDLEQAVRQARRTDLEPLARVALGNVLYESWSLDEAAEQYAAALKDLPDDKGSTDQVLFRLALCHERRGRWDRSKTYLSQIIHKFPGSQVGPAARRHFAADGYTIQCGAYDSYPRATAQVRRLIGHGLPARMVQDPRTRYHVVQVGKYDSYASARQGLGQVLSLAPEAFIAP